MKGPFQSDVFLSHNPADKPRVRRLAERLRAAGLCHSSFGFRVSGFGFPPEAALSPAALGSDRVTLERSTVGSTDGRGNLPFRDSSDAGRCFIPFLLAALGPMKQLGTRQTAFRCGI